MFERLTLGTYGMQFEPAQRSGFTTPDVDDPTPASDGSVVDSDASTILEIGSAVRPPRSP